MLSRVEPGLSLAQSVIRTSCSRISRNMLAGVRGGEKSDQRYHRIRSENEPRDDRSGDTGSDRDRTVRTTTETR